MMTDIRYGLRQLVKHPGFTLIAVLTLALGIGANTAIFSVVNAVLLKPLPFPAPEELVAVGGFDLTETISPPKLSSMCYPDFFDFREQNRSFSSMAVYQDRSLALVDEQEAQSVRGEKVSGEFFDVLGVKAMLGRGFARPDEQAGGGTGGLKVILSYGFWQRHFNRADDVIGRVMMLDGRPHTVIGVMPQGFQFPIQTEPIELYITIAEDASTPDGTKPMTQQRGSHGLLGIARVKAGLPLAQANAELRAIAGALEKKYPETNTRWSAGSQPLRDEVVGDVRTALYVLFGAVACLLLIANANVANLMLARASVRGKEIGFTVAIALISGLLVGLWPAWRVSQASSLSLALHESARGSSDGIHRQRTRSALVVTQVALAVVLLAGGGLMLKSFWNAQQARLGFSPRSILTMNVALAAARYDKEENVVAFYQQLLARVAALPSVTAAAIGNNVPFDDNEWDASFHITGTATPPHGQELSAEMNTVSPDYFRVMGMPILRGRAFGPEDAAGKPGAVIIDETLAARYFAGKDPIGLQMDNNQSTKPNPPPLTIIGIVPRTRNEAPGEENIEKLNFPQIYLCAAQMPHEDVVLLVRVASGDPLALAAAVKREVQAIDPVSSISTMEKNIGASLAARRLTMSLLGAFAGLALVLASVGIYGVMALSTTQRTRELGIRLALGASRGDVLRLILGQGISLIVIGLAAGLLGAFAASRALSSLLYGVGSLDAAALVGALVMLAAVAFVACYLPARRASLVDPIEALRTE